LLKQYDLDKRFWRLGRSGESTNQPPTGVYCLALRVFSLLRFPSLLKRTKTAKFLGSADSVSDLAVDSHTIINFEGPERIINLQIWGGVFGDKIGWNLETLMLINVDDNLFAYFIMISLEILRIQTFRIKLKPAINQS